MTYRRWLIFGPVARALGLDKMENTLAIGEVFFINLSDAIPYLLLGMIFKD